MMSDHVKIIDLFAGPGGLGEGFSVYRDKKTGECPFSIAVSVEKEASAHKTLQLRSFFRKFSKENVPDEYYQYVRGEITKKTLFDAYPEEAKAAYEETLHEPRALGVDDEYIYKQIRKSLREHDGPKVVIGGPPCQAYSLVGRARNMGKIGYDAKKDHRHFLYKEYLNILNIVEPEVFVMENVKGILSSTVDGELIFPKILNDLRCPGKAIGKSSKYSYRIFSFVKNADNQAEPVYDDLSDFIIRSEDYGVPQTRHRVILLGVRNDIRFTPGLLERKKGLSIEKVIGEFPSLRSGLSKSLDSTLEWKKVVKEIIKNFPEHLRAEGLSELASKIDRYPYKKVDAELRGGQAVYAPWSTVKSMSGELKDWYRDQRLKYILNHETRGHIVDDLKRYYFCASFAYVNSQRENPNPKSHEFPRFLAPKHKNWETGKFSDRFRVQVAGKCATTITSHISKDGHYFIHYDPLQCRSLTVREAARIQTFPDNYFFEGTRTQQYVQVGNAVPPLLANKLAEIVYDLLR
ncbi:MAG: DNA (cytosine-5-)-methyltransferase [Cellvibrio sp. 79]|nr:MAG: DNA (cytosine-5-)-methyltransferase [Cellvibrio sp. 79]